MPLTNPIPADPTVRRINAPELDEDIKAIPLVAPDFTNPEFKSPDIIGRWIEFKARDGLRYQQALAQGYTNVTMSDLADSASLKVYCKEAGTKYINGDVILMKIDRRRYLGALKHRFHQSAALSDPAVQQAVAKASAQAGLTDRTGRMAAFAPNAADLKEVGVDVTKVPGLGGTTGVDKATGADIRAGK
jgi:hypothetical protein